MVLTNIGDWINAFTELMNTGLMKNDLVYIDLWSVGHIVLGMTLMYMIVKYKLFEAKKTNSFRGIQKSKIFDESKTKQ